MKYNFLLTILFFWHFAIAQHDTLQVETVIEKVAYDEELYDEGYDEVVAEEVIVQEGETYEDFYERTSPTIALLLERAFLQDSLQERTLEENFQTKYNGEDFDYSLTKPRESLWSKIERWLAEFFARFFSSSDAQAVNNLTVWILRILAIGIIGLVVYWLAKYVIANEGFGIFAKKDKQINPKARTIEENIHEIDFDNLIQTYELNKDYRYAVRYHYLHLLKILNDKSLLTWDPEKTNLDYVNELNDEALRQDFARLTHIFDYVWYGEFAVDEESYGKIKSQFTSLKQSI